MTKPCDCLNNCGDDSHNAKAARALAAHATNRTEAALYDNAISVNFARAMRRCLHEGPGGAGGARHEAYEIRLEATARACQ